MSNSLASAKRRRAAIPTTESIQPQMSTVQQPQPQPPTPTPNKLSIPAYLSLLENRLLSMEKKLGSENTALMVEIDGPDGTVSMQITDYMEDMDKRFQMMAEEITTMKDTVLSLQRYTMEVNQNLLSQLTQTQLQAPVIDNVSLEDIISSSEHLENEVDTSYNVT